ncbi:hypothetical protein, partial [Peribacillus aracenensis]|uniref:hypothetical protein n=1 Tax=Peribacillus aracenensis TaxID=2976708 RepID=UPI0021A63FE1
SRCSLSAGRAVSLLGVNAYGVSPVPLLPQESRTCAPFNLKSFRFKNDNLYEKSHFLKILTMICEKSMKLKRIFANKHP